MGSIAWEMTVDTALEFYKRCVERNAETEEERMEILAELAKEGKMTSVTSSKNTKEEYIREKAKHFKILKITKKDDSK